MAKTWDIFRKSTDPDKQPVATVHELEYHGEWMEDEYVIVTVKNPEPIDWKRGDNLTYRGEKFSVYYDPKVIKKARSGSYLEGFTYENVKLYSEAARLKDINFNDIVLADNMIPYTSLNTFSFFAETVDDLADRIQANLDRMEPGEWNVYTPNYSRTEQRLDRDQSRIANWSNYYETSDTVGKTDVNVNAEGLKCWDALKLSYTAFDVNYFVTGRTIVIGGKAILAGQKMDGSSESDGHDFRYGKGMGLYEIERTTNEDSKVVTKLFAYGSEKNVPLGYYANLGKRILIPICHKTQREILQGNPDLILWVNKSWLSVKNAFNSNYEVKLSCNGHTAVFFVSNHTYTYADEAQDNTLDHETEYLTFYALSSHEDALAFYNGISAGMSVYVLSGANINKMPSEFIQLPQNYNYTAALSINKLMLPGFPQKDLFSWVVEHGATNIDVVKKKATWHGYTAIFSTDKQDPYIISPNFEKEGICEGSVTFDESSGQEICPTIEGTGLDEVLWAEQMDDNGYLGESPKAGETSFGFMSQSLFNDDGSLRYEIDWSDNDGEVVITMKDGACVGREFKMQKAKRNDNGDFELTLERYYDSSIGRYFPYREQGSNTLYQVIGRGNSHGINQGNHFIATGIHLPDSYVELAAEKLLEEALKHLASVDHQNYTYIPKVDEIYMQRQDDFTTSDHSDNDEHIAEYGTVSLHETLHAGMQMEIEDDDLDVHYKPFIDVLTIKENGNNGIPTYDVVLRDEKEMTLQERIQSQIEGGKSGVLNINGSGISEADLENIGSDLFLSKTKEDQTEFLVSFLGGMMVDKSLKSPAFYAGEWEKVKDTETGLWTKVHSGEGLGVYEDRDGGWHIELDYATIRKMLQTKELESLKAYFGSEDYYNPEESVLSVNGNAEFSHHLSSPEFQSGFLSGKGWAIKRVVFKNALGEDEIRYTLEIDNITVRNTLRVYEMIISQLRGENDNYLFAAMAEVHHYDSETGKVWLSTEGGKIYMPFRPGDYIMVQRYQPGNTGKSGGDGYVTKSYELVVVDCNSGGEVDENGDRLDWVLFKSFTTQMMHDAEGDYYHTDEEIAAKRAAVEADLRRQHPSWSELKVSDEAEEIMNAEVFLTPEELIEKGDTFCRLDNESDPERKGIIGITSVGPDTPYMDVMYGRKTDPQNFLKGRLGNLEGIKSEEFGWLQGFGAYLINLYGVGKFFNAQTGESMESRIEATNERLRSAYREKGYDINENDNKVKNGFFQKDLDGWTPCNTIGTKLSDPTEMEAYNIHTDPVTGKETADWRVKNPNGSEDYSLCAESVNGVNGDNLLMNGLQLEIQKTEKVELTTSEGVQVLHLNNAGVIQDFTDMKPNTAHKKAVVDDEEFEDPTKAENQQPEYEKCTYKYWEDYYIDWLHEHYPEYTEQRVQEVIHSQTGVAWINSQVEASVQTANQQMNYLSSTEEEVDKLYLGIRILPLTSGTLRVGFLKNGETWSLSNGVSINCTKDVKWNIETESDHPEEGETWYFPVDTDEVRKQGRFLVSYSGECYIRFVVLQNDPIDEEEHEYETLFEQNARRIRMQAKFDNQQFADWVIQYNGIIQRVTDNKKMADDALKDILGITTNPDGTYDFPDGWFDQNYSYASWLIHTKNRMDFLFTKWDDDDNLIAYSDRTQTADFINEIIAATNEGRDIGAKYKTLWGDVSTTLHETFEAFNDAWDEALDDGVLTAEELGRLKSLYRSLTDMFNSAKEAKEQILLSEYIKDLEDTQEPKKSIKEKWGELNIAYGNMNTAYNLVLEIPAGSSIDDATMKNKNKISALNTSLTAFDKALKNFDNVIFNARNYVSKKLAEATKAVKDKYEADQQALDQKIRDAYGGQNVNFLSWVSDTAWSSIQAKAIFDNSGKIKKESISTQTAELIENAINDYGNGQFSDVKQYANGFEHFVASLANAKETEYDYKEYKEVQDSLNQFLEDNVINKSEYESIKALRKSLESEYKDVVATYIKIYGDSNLSGTVKTTLYTAYNNLVSAYSNNSNTGADDRIGQLLSAYETAIESQSENKEYVKVSDTLKNRVNTALATFNTRMEEYKNALDTASGYINKAVAQGLIDQLKEKIDPGVLKGDPNYDYATFKTETSNGFETIAGAFDPTTKKLEKISTWVQTAEGFEQEVKNARGGKASLKVRIDGINTTVTNNQTAADTAIKNLRQSLYGNENATTGQNGSLATWFTQKHDKIDLIAGKFDASGNPTVASGIVVSTGSGDTAFSSLFATAVKNNGIAKKAELSVYVQKNEQTGVIESGVELTANQLNFDVDNIEWKLKNSWKIRNSKNKDVLYFDSSGNLKVEGQITANQTNLSTTNITSTGDITSTGSINVGGDFILDNGKRISWWNKGKKKTLSMLTLDSSNNFIVGESMAAESLTTYIRGYRVRLQSGSNYDNNVTLDENGLLTIKKLKIGYATLEWVSGKGLQVDQNFFSTGALSALGSGTSGSGGGTDLGAVWASLTTHTDAYAGNQIDLEHLKTAIGQYLNNYGYSKNAVDLTSNQNVGGIKNFTGQVGIGTSSPKKKLHVMGGIITERTTAEGGGFTSIYGSYAAAFGCNSSGSLNLNNGTVDSDGKISTSSCARFSPTSETYPYMWLRSGTRIYTGSKYLYLGKADNSGWVYLSDCCGNTSEGQTSEGNWSLRHSGEARFQYVGINGYNTGYRLYVNGTGYFTNKVTVNANGFASKHVRDTSDAVNGLEWQNTSGVCQACLQHHNTVNRIFINATGASSVWDDAVGKYSLLIGKNELKYNTYDILHTGNVSSNLVTTNTAQDNIIGSKKFSSIGVGIATQGAPWLFSATYAYVNNALSIGGKNSGYSLYVNGTSYFTNILNIAGTAASDMDSTHPNFSKYTSAKFYVKGDAVINGTAHAGSYNTISDMRVKTVTSYIDDLTLTVEDIARAPLFNFKWKYFEDKREHVGTSAQYWLSKLPNVVDGRGNEVLSMDYDATAYSAAVITARKVLDHEGEIKALKKRIGELEKEVEQLKAA